MAGFEVLNREISSFSMNHLPSLLSANPASLFLHFTLDSSCPKHLIILSAAWTFMYLCLFNLSFFFLILQASAQVSIIVKTFSPPPERDSALTPVTPHYCVHLSDLSVCVCSKQQISMLGTSRRFRHYPVFNGVSISRKKLSFFLFNCLNNYVICPSYYKFLEYG